jgi:hypothetical protein
MTAIIIIPTIIISSSLLVSKCRRVAAWGYWQRGGLWISVTFISYFLLNFTPRHHNLAQPVLAHSPIVTS